jgi:hypothetical protein
MCCCNNPFLPKEILVVFKITLHLSKETL